ncbi:unnamed protein product [Adineta ricciae]|uniref:Uncharacterized protein n=1 Tax=Adineta ricciae TaxID=249248 RepID=A0A815HNF1_ADIRI|nr:unnamed protein product [Adineta ricciae]CAF1354938.1 unnamed protein product [Adineta ricciae]
MQVRVSMSFQLYIIQQCTPNVEKITDNIVTDEITGMDDNGFNKLTSNSSVYNDTFTFKNRTDVCVTTTTTATTVTTVASATTTMTHTSSISATTTTVSEIAHY